MVTTVGGNHKGKTMDTVKKNEQRPRERKKNG